MEEKNCKNCAYYIPHFVRRNYYFHEIDGHCTNADLRKNGSPNNWKLHENCGKWKSGEQKKEEQKKSLDEVLRGIAKTLEEIRLLLLTYKT